MPDDAPLSEMAVLTLEMRALRAETQAGLADVRASVAEVRTDVAVFRSDTMLRLDTLTTALAEFRAEYNGHSHES